MPNLTLGNNTHDITISDERNRQSDEARGARVSDGSAAVMAAANASLVSVPQRRHGSGSTLDSVPAVPAGCVEVPTRRAAAARHCSRRVTVAAAHTRTRSRLRTANATF